MQRLSPRFRSQQFSYARYAEKLFTQIYSDLYGDGHASVHPDGHQYGGWKPTETSFVEFC